MPRYNQEPAEYICLNDCIYPTKMDDGSIQPILYRRHDFGEVVYGYRSLVSKSQMSHTKAMGQSLLSVPRGTVVPYHFIPNDEAAWDDREDQMAEPAKYVKTEDDLIRLAEIMWKVGGFDTKSEAMDAIRELIPQEKLDNVKANDADVAYESKIDRIVAGEDDKTARKRLCSMLEAAGVKHFKGWKVRKLAALVLENDLA